MEKNRVVLVSIVSNSALIAFKVVAGILMGSVAVISEAIHSSIDLIASVVAYIAIAKADEPADAGHPFGHGKFENISGFFEALLIFFAAGIIVAEAIQKLLNLHSVVVSHYWDWGIGVMAISTIVNLVVSRTLFIPQRSTAPSPSKPMQRTSAPMCSRRSALWRAWSPYA